MALNSKPSYLCARDPSILSWSTRKDTWKIRANYNDLFQESMAEHPEENTVTKVASKESNNLEIILRIKNADLADLYSLDESILYANIPKTSHFARYARGDVNMIKKFTFSKIFSPTSSQEDIFNDVIKPKLLSFINGCNESILSYGCSGSGKTYTIIGTESNPGIIPRSLEYLFKSLPNLPKEENVTFEHIDRDVIWTNFTKVMNGKSNRFQKKFNAMQNSLNGAAILDNSAEGLDIGVWVSFAEIYNEQVFDLFEFEDNAKNRTRLIVCTNKGRTYIKNLKHIYISTAAEAYELLQCGMEKLNYASTGLNMHSSRSHCIFTIKLLQLNSEDESVQCSVINFCDLAGSERIKKTHNIGKRLKESNNINTSLMVLGKCISTIRNNQKNKENTMIPYRESKLTQLFQKALSGYEDVAMIVNINPILDMFDESMRVLMFSSIASEIILEEPEGLKNNRFSLYMQRKNKDVSKKENVQQIVNLQQTIGELFDALQNAHKQKQDMEGEIKSRLIARFEKILQKNNEEWEEKVQLLESKLEELNEELENYIPAKRAKLDESVICLDDSLNDMSCSNCKNLQETLVDAEKQYQELESKYQDMYIKYICASENNEDLINNAAIYTSSTNAEVKEESNEILSSN